MKKFWLSSCVILFCSFYASNSFPQSLWELANENKDILRISNIITARDLRDILSTDEGIDNAIDWCKKTGLTRVFLEVYREEYTAERGTLERAKARFEAAGIEASGGVTTTNIGKASSTGSRVCCYSSKETLKELQRIFEYAASIFDEIIIDDWFFTDCECEDCQKARGGRRMSEYRCDLMKEVSREYVLKPAKAVNPNVKVIIKFPLWYDNFHNRGYDVVRQSDDYDIIWVGTETRDYDYDVSPRGEVQYAAYYIMRWLGGIGGEKTGGGWFDHGRTSPDTFAEQARQTVLADAREMTIWNFGANLRRVDNIEKFRRDIPGLFELAKMVRNKPLIGIHEPKPPNSEPFEEPYIYSILGMLGLPLVPAHEIDERAESAVFPVHVLKDLNFSNKLERMLKAGKPVMITDGLARRLTNQSLLENENLIVLKVEGEPKNLLKLSQEDLKPIRDKLLAPLGLKFDAPNKVALYLIGNNHIIVENFNDEPVSATLEYTRISSVKKILTLPEEANVDYDFARQKLELKSIPSRALVAFEY